MLCIQKNYLYHARYNKTYYIDSILFRRISLGKSIIFKSNCAFGSFSFHVSPVLLPSVGFSSEIVGVNYRKYYQCLKIYLSCLSFSSTSLTYSDALSFFQSSRARKISRFLSSSSSLKH